MSARTTAADDAVDLQLHTIYSDGHWRPTELIAYLAEHGFRVAAITDHDQLDHVDELVALGEAHGVTILPAVEVTTSWRGMRADLLCYAAAFTSDALKRLVQATEQAQYQNTLAVYEELLRRGYTFPHAEAALPDEQTRARRPSDNALLALWHGYVKTFAQGLDLMRDAGYQSIQTPLDSAVEAAHASGAVALIAHPGRNGGEISRWDPPLLSEVLRSIPLDGVEVLYPTHTPEQVAAYAAFVEERGLLRSAGSDSHGPKQRYPIAYPAQICAALLARCGVEVMA